MTRPKPVDIPFVRVKIHLKLGNLSKDVDGRCFRRICIKWFDKLAKEKGLIEGGTDMALA